MNKVLKSILAISVSLALALPLGSPAWANSDSGEVSAASESLVADIPMKENADALTISDAEANPNWLAFGTCEWMIDDAGCLIVRPAPGEAIGQFPNDESFPWIEEEYRTRIDTVVFEGSLHSGQSLEKLFYGCGNINSIQGLASLDTSSATDMSYMFRGCNSLSSLDVSSFDTSSVTDMSNMFSYCRSLASLDLSSFDTSSVTDMSNMFSYCNSLSSLDISSIDTSSATDTSYMFYGCKSLSPIDVSSFDTSSVTDMSNMFYGCQSLASLDLSSFDTSSVTDMSRMFEKCDSLASLDLSSFDTSSVTNMVCMFCLCDSLASLDLSSFNTSSVIYMNLMFYKCPSLTCLDLSSFDTSSVVGMSEIFSGCDSLKELDISSFDTRKVTFTSSSDEFLGGCNELLQISTGENFTLQKKLPQSRWINSRGQEFAANDIPKGVADTYTSLSAIVDIVEPEEAASGFHTGDALTLEVITDPPSLASLLHWSSSDSAVVSVDEKGKVTAHNAGTAVISAGLGE